MYMGKPNRALASVSEVVVQFKQSSFCGKIQDDKMKTTEGTVYFKCQGTHDKDCSANERKKCHGQQD